ncbi:MAG TPA: GIY-YIG nuclease family protein [Candidatus Brocadiales bacterium]|nr:GIY-YIG nuclease family protein [Candidatus Brocadiales bacterium]
MGKQRLRIPKYDTNACMCIYALENSVTGKCYVGLTTKKLLLRINAHFAELRKGINNPMLQSDYNEHGEESFSVRILYKDAENKEQLRILEGIYTNLYRSNEPEFGYNLIIPGLINTLPSSSREKMKNSWTDEKRLHHSKKRHEFHEKEGIKAPILSEDARLRISKKAKERFANGGNNLLGFKQSQESINQGSEKRKGMFSGFNNPASRALIAYDMGDQRQYYFRTVSEASDYFKISKSCIDRSVRGTPTRSGLSFMKI